jgi:glyoxylase-like metal-dependent hydrolase (beta-lactamase superfamily II)
MARPKPVFTQITPQIFKLISPGSAAACRSALTLIDADRPAEDHIIAQVLEQTGGRIPDLVLTHYHADHGAAAEHVRRRLPVAAGRDEIPT